MYYYIMSYVILFGCIFFIGRTVEVFDNMFKDNKFNWWVGMLILTGIVYAVLSYII